jgi:hypothetical protein
MIVQSTTILLYIDLKDFKTKDRIFINSSKVSLKYLHGGRSIFI